MICLFSFLFLFISPAFTKDSGPASNQKLSPAVIEEAASTDQKGKAGPAAKKGEADSTDQRGKAASAGQKGKAASTDQRGKTASTDQKGKAGPADQQGKTATPTDQQGKAAAQKAKRLPASSNILTKEEALPKDYGRPKYSAAALMAALRFHLKKMGTACSNKREALRLSSKMNSLRRFLKSELQDPFMEEGTEILFKIILLVIGENPSNKVLTVEDFRNSYKIAFGIREEIKASDYPTWAAQIEKALACAEKATNSE